MKYAVVLTALSALGMSACHNSSAAEGNKQAIDTFIQKMIDALVRVEGGSFQMGDFGPIDPNLTGSNKGLPYSAEQDNKPLHKVTLDTFYMSPTKVTYQTMIFIPKLRAKIKSIILASSRCSSVRIIYLLV
ncbi:hypothetical protein HHA02_34350 [Cobetia marina]|nr:hypothetical protein HHA02_34350 [Cobetia marina]